MSTNKPLLVAIDQGTSSSRTVVFDAAGRVVTSAQQAFPQEYPRPGWVEHDPEAIWESVVAVTREALSGCDVGAVAGPPNLYYYSVFGLSSLCFLPGPPV